MAGDWLKVEANTPDKQEVIAIAEMLGIAPAYSFGCLFLVWRWFDQQTTDGNAARVSKLTIDRLSGVTGFADAMLVVGWLSVNDDNSIALPNFDRHCGETSKQRALTAKRVAKHKVKSNAECNASSVSASLPSALPREEKSKPIPITPKKSAIAFKTFLADCKDKSEKPISDYAPAFDYAQSIGLPDEMLMLCWSEFYRRHNT
ncbi:MAG: hypothetical protein WBN97_01285 [Parvibaculum sp.]